MRLFTYLLLLETVSLALPYRLHNDPEVAAKIPREIKQKIDKLLEEKLQLYMDTFFGEKTSGYVTSVAINKKGEDMLSYHKVEQNAHNGRKYIVNKEHELNERAGRARRESDINGKTVS